jgi:hypothetical protein
MDILTHPEFALFFSLLTKHLTLPFFQSLLLAIDKPRASCSPFIQTLYNSHPSQYTHKHLPLSPIVIMKATLIAAVLAQLALLVVAGPVAEPAAAAVAEPEAAPEPAVDLSSLMKGRGYCWEYGVPGAVCCSELW